MYLCIPFTGTVEYNRFLQVCQPPLTNFFVGVDFFVDFSYITM